MFFYLFYWLGSRAALLLPLKVSYWIASRTADFWSRRSLVDREAVRLNLCAVLNTDQISPEMVNEVFRNFAKYLVDFFRFSSLTPQRLRSLVRIEGLENMKAALSQGRGAIGLTAHLGNFELAGAVLSLMGMSVNAVVLTHQNSRVDAFFTRQRNRVGVKIIPIQKQTPREFYVKCVSALRGGEILALVGDRDFFSHGLELPLFGKTIKVPTGPANFSLKTGAPIVPGFLVREKDGSYSLFFEKPIAIPRGIPREEAEKQMTQACLNVMAQYIRRYPTQWYGFREFWRQIPAVII